MNSRLSLREKLTSERGTPDLLAFMAISLLVVAFGIVVLLPAALSTWIESTVRQDPRIMAEVNAFVRNGTDAVSPCDPATEICTRSGRITELLNNHGFVRDATAEYPIRVRCGTVHFNPTTAEELQAKATQADYVIRTEENIDSQRPLLIPGGRIYQDEQVGCEMIFTPQGTGIERGWGLLDVLIGNEIVLLERGSADSAFNTRIH